jgi:hypothetical protein
MSAYLTAEMIRGRQHEIAASTAHSHHRRELLGAKRSRRSVRSLLPRFPRLQTTEALAASRTR